MDVHEYDEGQVADGADEVARLARHAPHLELERVAASFVEIFEPVESQLLLKIVSAMVVVEKQVMVR